MERIYVLKETAQRYNSRCFACSVYRNTCFCTCYVLHSVYRNTCFWKTRIPLFELYILQLAELTVYMSSFNSRCIISTISSNTHDHLNFFQVMITIVTFIWSCCVCTVCLYICWWWFINPVCVCATILTMCSPERSSSISEFSPKLHQRSSGVGTIPFEQVGQCGGFDGRFLSS